MLSPVGFGFVWSASVGPWKAVLAPTLDSELLEGRDQGLFVSGSLSTGHAGLRGTLGMK